MTDEDIGAWKREGRCQRLHLLVGTGLCFRAVCSASSRGAERQGEARGTPTGSLPAGQQVLCTKLPSRAPPPRRSGEGPGRRQSLLILPATFPFDVSQFRFWHPERQRHQLPAPAASPHQNGSWQGFPGTSKVENCPGIASRRRRRLPGANSAGESRDQSGATLWLPGESRAGPAPR